MTQTVRKLVWAPQPGPQKLLIDCPLPEIFFGGSRGGGKTDGVLGKFALKGKRYGKHFNAVFFRKEMPQQDDLVERAKEIYLPLGARWQDQRKAFNMPQGGRVRFRPLETRADAEKYQGQNLCVAVGTLIRMADGSLCAIELIRAGDSVQTLEGPRRVKWITQPYVAPCVEAQVLNSSGESIGVQVHPVWHPVLTTAGISLSGAPWAVAAPPDYASSAARISSRRLQIPHICRRLLSGIGARREASEAHRRSEHQALPAWCAFSADDRSGCTASVDDSRESLRPAAWSVPVVLHVLGSPTVPQQSPHCHDEASVSGAPRRSSEPCEDSSAATQTKSSDRWQPLLRAQRLLASLGARVRVVRDAFRGSAAQGSLASCQSSHGCGDALLRHASETDLTGTRSRAGAAGQNRNALSDGSDTTRTHSPTSPPSWVHPYTGEARSLIEAVTHGTMECRPIGDSWVTDLCVEGANHYIGDTGLINKNTDAAVEEAGNYSDPSPIDRLFGVLRSAKGVPTQLILTGNPGGPGQGWIKQRYIDPAPMGLKVIERPLPNGSIHRYVYIPSRVTNNRILLNADPEYINRLYLVGSVPLVRAWLEGDWSAIEGAYFPEFSPERHVIAPFAIPDHWARIRGMDWGSAKPFCVLWAAVSDGTVPGIRRGALVFYREWYGWNGTHNTGCRLTAPEVGQGIRELERGEKMADEVLDPAAFSQDGGPSIAERLDNNWRRADNARVGRNGAMGGWDQVRERLKGDEEGPMVYFFSTNTHIIRTLPALQHDPSRAEDVDTDSEDHAADTLRYVCMSRPMIRDNPKDTPPRFDTNLTINEIIRRQTQRRLSE